MARNTYIGTVKAGKLELSDPIREKMTKDIARLDGYVIELEIRKKARRSNAQNAYYWAVVIPLVKEGLKSVGMDLTNDETHEALKYKFNSYTKCNDDGEVIATISRSSSDMNKTEFMEFLTQIQQWSAMYLNTVIPDPEQQMKFEF